VELEKRLERVEKAMNGLWVGFAAGLVVAGLACVLSLVALLYRPAPQPPEQPADRPEQPEARKTSYLEELERLETLRSKGALTQQEFDAKKQQLLAAPAPGKGGDVDELDKLLRDVQALYNRNTITLPDYNAKKQQYLQRKITVVNLTKDLQKGEKLYNDNILTLPEWQALKQQLLAADPALGKK
jgi:hypothetical protein